MEKATVPQKGGCRICFTNENNLNLTLANSEKFLKNCGAYLDTATFIKSFENDNTLSCCKYCYESAYQLILLEEQVEKLQKHISDLSFLFSKNVLERRNRLTNRNHENINESSPPTENYFTTYTNPDSHSIVIDEEIVKKEVTENRSNLLFDAGIESLRNKNSPTVFVGSTSRNNLSDINNADNFPSSSMEIMCRLKENYVGAVKCWMEEEESTNDEGNETVDIKPINEGVNLGEETMKLEDNFNEDSDKSYKCCICGQCFMNKQDLKDHYKMHNNKDNLHPCSFCDKSFAKEELLKKHETIHTKDGPPFTCSICSKSFNHSINLSNHKLTHSAVSGSCEKLLKNSDDLNDHEQIQCMERPYKCSFCEKSFFQPWLAKTHEKFHTEERPFNCSLCSKSFKTVHHLKSHQQYHSGDKPFTCSYCPKSFKQSSDAKRHEKTHTKDRPHKCSSCEKCFQHKYDLKTHHKRMHEKKEEFILS